MCPCQRQVFPRRHPQAWPCFSYRLSFSQMNGAVTGTNRQQAAAAVELATNIVLANLSFGRDRHVEIDVAVACVQVNIRGEVAGDFQRDAAVARFQPPVSGS
jgi:hypothetical protein